MGNKKLGDKLRGLRNAKGYTQQQVADMIGLKNKSTLGSWEVGKSEPDGYTLLRLCKIYDVEDIYLAFEDVPSTATADEAIKNQSISGSSNEEQEVIVAYRNASPKEKNTVRYVLGLEEIKEEEKRARSLA